MIYRTIITSLKAWRAMADRRIYLFVIGCLLPLCARSQAYNGLTGLLQVPSAETDTAGTFRGNISFLHRAFMPAQMPDKNTMSYTIGITPFRWMEVSYGAALLWMYKNRDKTSKKGFYNEDRRVNVKVTPLYEGRWWPAIALGMDDVGRFNRISNGTNNNNYFQNIYGVASKHFGIHGWELGAHIAYRYYTSEKNKERRGVAGGLTLRPAFYHPLRVVAEWDGIGVNVGADVLLWRRLFLPAALVHGRGFTGGVSYRYTIPH